METGRPRAAGSVLEADTPCPVAVGPRPGASWQHWARIWPCEGKGGRSAQRARAQARLLPPPGGHSGLPRRGEGADSRGCTLQRLSCSYGNRSCTQLQVAMAPGRPGHGGGAGPEDRCGVRAAFLPGGPHPLPSEGGAGLGSHRWEGAALELTQAHRLPPPKPLGLDKGWEGRWPRCRRCVPGCRPESTAQESWQSWQSWCPLSPTACPGAAPLRAGPPADGPSWGSLSAELEPERGGDREVGGAVRSSELPIHGASKQKLTEGGSRSSSAWRVGLSVPLGRMGDPGGTSGVNPPKGSLQEPSPEGAGLQPGLGEIGAASHMQSPCRCSRSRGEGLPACAWVQVHPNTHAPHHVHTPRTLPHTLPEARVGIAEPHAP